ncbi:MAG: LTA synthase family protein [Selenomonadaceae bacterium]|nr:LTA synthase family protein [Selenomonadaceae bacterium]
MRGYTVLGDYLAQTALNALKLFAFYWGLLGLFRLFFVLWLGDYWGENTGWPDVLTALVRGERLSAQTAGVLTLVTLLPGAVIHFLWPMAERTVASLWRGFVLGALSLLYVASFPFYRQFHANFNQMVFTGLHEDFYALGVTMVQEYYLPLRLLVVFGLTYCLWRLLEAWLKASSGARPLFSLPCTINDKANKNLLPGQGAASPLWGLGQSPNIYKWLKRLALAAACYAVAVFSIFGGSFGWETAVDWENAGVTKDDFLNEAILDNCQALYRSYELNSRLLSCNGLNFTVDDIRLLAAHLAKRAPDSDELDDYLLRHAQGAQIEKPRHIFVILAESFANWPLLPQYEYLGIADGVKNIIAAPDSDYSPTFLPNGASTVSAVTGTVTGFADANLYLTTMQEAFAAPYPTASGPQLAALGYETHFWYAGPASWERIGAFVKAQGYDFFHSRGDYGDAPGSVWGCEDEILFAKVTEAVANKAETPGFHVILTASNHSPYDLDLPAKGFEAEKLRRKLPPENQGDDWLIKELGHYWYADREMARFVATVKSRFPDSLILIVGDHADRYHLKKVPLAYERYAIPFIVTGRGIHHGTLLKDSAGSHIDLIPTIIELIAPKGHPYRALGASLTRDNRQGVNYGFWIRRDAFGEADRVPLEPQSLDGSLSPPIIDDQAMQDYINAIRAISWWRPKYGSHLDEAILERVGR